MINIKYPDALKNLPVAKSIQSGEIRLDGSLVLVAATGSGKTMLVPVIKALSGRKVVLRQPTRQTAKLTYLGLNMFWGDQLKIGIHTSEEDVGTLEDYNIMVCTDGVLKNWLKNLKYKLTVVMDELHWIQPISEVELSLVKEYLNDNANLEIVLLSATIRPSNIVKYFENLNPNPVSASYIERICDVLDNEGAKVNTMEQEQWLKCYYSEGIAYPIENRICPHLEDSPAHHGTIMDFAKRMLDEEKRGLVFLCTRAKVQNARDLIADNILDLPVEFAHADIKIENIIKFVKDNEPSVLFATVSLATSATLPFDEVLIIDEGIDSVYENGVEKQVTDIPIDMNGLLQRRGRSGRIKPGVCTLASNYRESWDGIRPTQIKPPLEKVAPIQAAMVCAQYGIDPRHLDTLSTLNDYDIDRSVKRLKSLRAVYEDGNTLKLTSIGRKIAALPLEVELAAMVAQCPDEILPIVIAIASCDAGTYSMFQTKVKIEIPDIDCLDDEKKSTHVHGSEVLDRDLIYPDSILLTKAKIVQAAYKARTDSDITLKEWCTVNGLLEERIKRILFKYYQICAKGLSKSEKKMKERLMDLDIDQYAKATINYLSIINVFDIAELSYDTYNGKPGYKGEHFGYFTILDGYDMQMMDLAQRELSDVRVLGTSKIIKTKRGSEICIFGDTTLLPEEGEYDV